MSDQALRGLLAKLAERGYAFVTPTPLSHARVIARPAKRMATSLPDIFGWNVPFAPGVLAEDLHVLLNEAGAIEPVDGGYKGKLRVSTVHGRLYLHAGFPTDAVDAVFLGPDSYRFADLIAAEVAASPPPPGARIVDVGTGAGVGAIVAADLCPGARVLATDVNPQALRLTAINAASAGVALETIERDGVAPLDGMFDLVLLNPPYIVDDEGRTYRHGGAMHGARLSLDLATQGLAKLAPGGRLILYTGSAIVDGRDALRTALIEAGEVHGATLRYRELDPDVFGEELDRPQYADVDRIALIAAVFTR